MKMCQALAQLGHNVTLVARKGAQEPQDDYAYYGVEPGFEILKFSWPNMRAGGLVYGTQIARWLRRQRRTYQMTYGRSIYGLCVAAALGLRCGYESHMPPGNKARYSLEKWLLTSGSFLGLVTISDSLRCEYLRLFPWLNPARVIVAHDGADLPPAIPQAQALPGRPDAVKVGYAGHLYPGKGVETIVRIARSLPEMDFHLVGGTEKDIAHWRSRTDLPNTFFHGFIPHGEVYRYHQAFDVLLLPCGHRVAPFGSKGDIAPWMSPLKMFEYMAAGKPIVASDLPVLREVLVNGINSILVEAEDIDAWGSALQRLERDPLFARRIATRAEQDFRSRYTWTQRTETILSKLDLVK